MVKGSYVGDIEIFMRYTRLFSTQAPEKTILLEISSDHLLKCCSLYPNAHMKLLRKSIKRYMRVAISMHATNFIKYISPTDEFWGRKGPQRLIKRSVALRRNSGFGSASKKLSNLDRVLGRKLSLRGADDQNKKSSKNSIPENSATVNDFHKLINEYLEVCIAKETQMDSLDLE